MKKKYLFAAMAGAALLLIYLAGKIFLSAKDEQANLNFNNKPPHQVDDSLLNLPINFNVKEFNFPDLKNILSVTALSENEIYILTKKKLILYNGREVKTIFEPGSDIYTGACSGKYLIYAVDSSRIPSYARPHYFIAKIINNTVVQHSYIKIPILHQPDQLQFIDDKNVLISAVMEYGILTFEENGGNISYSFKHFPEESIGINSRLALGSAVNKDILPFHSYTAVSIIDKSKKQLYFKKLFDLKEMIPGEIFLGDAIYMVSMINEDEGCFILDWGDLFFFNKDSLGKYTLERINSVETVEGRIIPSKDIRKMFYLNSEDIFFTTYHGELFYKQYTGEKRTGWNLINSGELLQGYMFEPFNDSSFFFYAAKLFNVAKIKESIAQLQKKNKNLFSVFRFMNTNSVYGIAADDYDGDKKDELYLVDIFGANRLHFLSSYDWNAFETYSKDAASERGATGITAGGNYDLGIASADIDESGSSDIIIGYLGSPPMLYLNNGKGYFQENSRRYNLDQITGRSECIVSGDVNNDGYLDLFVGCYLSEDKLVLNNYGAGFSSNNIKLESNSTGTVTATFSDINNDGLLDLYIGKWMRENKLYLNKGNGEFVDFTIQSGTSCGVLKKTNSVLFADFDNDGDMDLFVGNRGRGNRLFLNDGNAVFTDVSVESNINDPLLTYGAIAADFDNDELIDLFVNDLGSINFYKNTGLNSKGIPVFKPVTDDFFARAGVFDGYNTAVIALDKSLDGDIDLIVGQYLGSTFLLENHISEIKKNSFITIRVEGSESNRSGIGTKLRLYKNGNLYGYREVSGGSGYASQSSKMQHFGINDLSANYKLEVIFPSGVIRSLDVNPGNKITVKEHEGLAAVFFTSNKNISKYLRGNEIIADFLKALFIFGLFYLFTSFNWFKRKLFRYTADSAGFPWKSKAKFLFFSLLAALMAQVIINESQALFFGNSLWINNTKNILIEDMLPVIIGLVAGLLLMRINFNKKLRPAFEYKLMEDLLISVRKFGHGEGMLMNLNRISLLLKNYNSSGEQTALIKRLEQAVEEFKKITLPELYKIITTVESIALSGGKLIPRIDYTSAALTLYNSTKSISDNLELFERKRGTGNGNKKYISEVINGIKILKSELQFIGSNVKEAASADIEEVVNNVIYKFESCAGIKIINNTGGIKAVIPFSEAGEVFSILVQNSLDAMNGIDGEDKRIKISGERLDGTVRIIIDDNGPGIPDDLKQKIFEEGFSTKKGTRGFGLSYAKRTIEKYGGKIYLEPCTIGTNFILELRGTGE